MAIKKIMCACGSGLGSSLMVQMNIDDVLRDLGKTDVSVDHTTISDVVPGAADLFVIGRDLENFVTDIPRSRRSSWSTSLTRTSSRPSSRRSSTPSRRLAHSRPGAREKPLDFSALPA